MHCNVGVFREMSRESLCEQLVGIKTEINSSTRNNTEGINKSNIFYFQNDGVTNQHNLVFGIPFKLEKSTS